MSTSSLPLRAFTPATLPAGCRAAAWFVADADGRCLAASPQWIEAAGLRAGEGVAGKRWERVVEPAGRDALAEQVSLQCNFGDGFQGECRLLRPDGRATRALLSVVPVAAPCHPDAAFVGLIVDAAPGLPAPAAAGDVDAWIRPALEQARARLHALPRPA